MHDKDLQKNYNYMYLLNETVLSLEWKSESVMEYY